MKPVALFLLGLIALLQSQAALADAARCPEAGYLAHFDSRLTPQPCEEIVTVPIRWRGGSAQLHAIRPRATAMTDSPVFIERIREIAAGVGTAMDRMGGGLRLDDVTVLFTDFVSPREAGSVEEGSYNAIASSPFGSECPVTYYKYRRGFPGDVFVFTVAHEIFHCIQFRNWPSMPEDGWLQEGSAEYFAFLAKRGFNGSAGHIAYFDSLIPGAPISSMDYPAVVFFLWLGQTYGAPRVREMVSSARSITGAISPDMWIEFAQSYFDRAIRRPDGGTISSAPQVGGTRNVRDNDVITVPPIVPFTLNNAILRFARNKTYHITYAPSAADARMRWRKTGGGAWGPPLTTVTTCEGEQNYRITWASTRSPNFGDIGIRAEGGGSGTTNLCVCPAGSWVETEESLRANIEVRGPGGGAVPQYIGGKRRLVLNPDHTGSISYDGIVSELHSSRDFWSRTTQNGTVPFTWVIANGRLNTVIERGNILHTRHETYARTGSSINFPRFPAQSFYHQFNCDGSGLHLSRSDIPAWLVAPSMKHISRANHFRRDAPR